MTTQNDDTARNGSDSEHSVQTLVIPNDPLEIVCDVLRKLAYLNIEECNGNFQRLVVGRIFATEKRVEDLTVGELTEIMQKASDDFNRTWYND